MRYKNVLEEAVVLCFDGIYMWIQQAVAKHRQTDTLTATLTESQ